MDQWVYAGSQRGIIDIESRPLEILYEDYQQQLKVFSLKLIKIQHIVQKDVENVSKKAEKQELGKQNLCLKSYIEKFKINNIHYFLQKSCISTEFTLQYEVFLEKTLEALQRIIFQHENISQQFCLGTKSQEQSVQSNDFSDKINEIEVKGENRLNDYVTFVSPDAVLRSQGKISSQDFIFISLNKKRDKRIIRSKDASVRVKLEERFTKNLQNTDKKPQLSQSTLHKSIVLKKLSSQEVRPGIKDFEIKRLQFKRKIIQNKQTGKQRPKPFTARNPQRNISIYSSARSMRTVRLSQWQKLPQKQPWAKKQKQITQMRNKQLLYFIIIFLLIVLYFLMQPFKNIELPLNENEIQLQQKVKQSEKKGDKRKGRFKIKRV